MDLKEAGDAVVANSEKKKKFGPKQHTHTRDVLNEGLTVGEKKELHHPVINWETSGE